MCINIVYSFEKFYYESKIAFRINNLHQQLSFKPSGWIFLFNSGLQLLGIFFFISFFIIFFKIFCNKIKHELK